MTFDYAFYVSRISTLDYILENTGKKLEKIEMVIDGKKESNKRRSGSCL
jgi:hypothetical protein